MLKDLSRSDILPLINVGKDRDDFINLKLKELSGKFSSPYPEPREYWNTVFDGFKVFPERLDNFIQAKGVNKRASFQGNKPYLIDLEPNSRCNFRCTMCQVSEWARGQRARDMTFQEFQSLRDLFDFVIEAKIHGMGEPLLHKEFFNMVEYLKSFSIWTRTSINGSLLLANNNIEKLVNSSLGEIQISLDGATKETYEKIRVRANFEKVTEGIKELNMACESENRNLTRMWVVLQENNIHELSKFVELAKYLKFRKLTFSLSLNDWGQELWRNINGKKGIAIESTIDKIKELFEKSIGEGLDISLWQQSNKYSVNNGPQDLCPWIFDRTYITSDMRLTPCAIIGNPDITDLGDASEILNSWNSEKYVSFRKLHLTGAIPNECTSCYRNEGVQVGVPGQKQIFVNISKREQ
jgi:MoaA/NifB/PqqE/SkfB family radical SAM enzyme